jgi:hypothetical protein
MTDKWWRSVVPVRDGPSPVLDTSVAHPARVYDYWLGGKDNFAADREVGEQTLQVYPNIALGVQSNRVCSSSPPTRTRTGSYRA